MILSVKVHNKGDNYVIKTESFAPSLIEVAISSQTVVIARIQRDQKSFSSEKFDSNKLQIFLHSCQRFF